MCELCVYIRYTLSPMYVSITLQSLNPVWKEKFEFPRVNQKEHFIIFEVFDEHRVTKDNCIGGIKVKLRDHRIEVGGCEGVVLWVWSCGCGPVGVACLSLALLV